MAGGEGLDPGLPAARHPAPWSDLATHRPGHGVLAHITAQLAAAADPRAVIVTADGLKILMRPWAVGFVGEEKVGLELALLDPEWHVLHSVGIGRDGADIDHLVIGPAGVFTIDTKHHAGAQVEVRRDAVRIGSKHTSYVRKARHEAQRARAALAAELPDAVPVTPLICTVGATVHQHEPPEGFWVVEDHRLVAALSGLAHVLTAEEVERVFEWARRSTTWSTTPPPPAGPPEVAAFARELGAAAASGRPPAGLAVAPIRRQPGLPRPEHPPVAPKAPGSVPPGRSRGSSDPPRPHLTLILLAVIVVLVAGPTILRGASQFIASAVPLSLPQPGFGPGGQDPAYTASQDLPVQSVNRACDTEGAQGRTLLGNRLLTCLPNDQDTLLWEYADPWLRLPIALQGTHCDDLGAHARNFARGNSALVCTLSADGQDRWIGDPDWTPPA